MAAEPRTETGRGLGPSLPQLVRPWIAALPRWARFALVVLAAGLVALALAVVLTRGDAVESYAQTESDARARGLEPIPFHFDYSRKMELSKPEGAYVRVERSVNGSLYGRFTVSSFRLGPQRGLLSGYMPIVATKYQRRVAPRFERFRLQFEGRARLNEVEGYGFAFTSRLRRPGHPPRQLFGRVVMLPEPFDATDPAKPYPPGQTPRRGLVLTMLATTLDNVPSATRVGDEGILQRPFRSFRFGSP